MPSTLIETNLVEELVQSGLPDTSLEVIIDAADAEIQRVVGPHDGERTVILSSDGYAVFLPVPAETIAEVKHWPITGDEEDAIVLGADEYHVRNEGRSLFYAYGFMDRVSVRYTPISSNSRRRQALVDLVKLEFNFSGKHTERIGEFSEQLLNKEEEKMKILRSLQYQYGGAGLFA